MHKPIIIAIDGPAASGKGTLARRLAEHFGLEYLDTGKLYRAVAYKMLLQGENPQDEGRAAYFARTVQAQELKNPDLMTETIGKGASIVAVFPKVREALKDFQRQFGRQGKGAILDGRDIGTVICPDADLKIFITADVDSRAKRRYKELRNKGIKVIYEAVVKDLKERDSRDSGRKTAPLKIADDAISLDTSEMDADLVFETVAEMIRSSGVLHEKNVSLQGGCV